MTTATKTHTADSILAPIQELMANFTAETTPASAKKVEDFRQHLTPGTDVYVTFLPGSDFKDTIAVCKRLRDEEMRPIPHFAARSIPSRDALEDNLKAVVEEAGVDRVLTIAGGVSDKEIVGPFSDSMQLLETGLFDRYKIKTIGVAGHPEGSPDMSQEAIGKALAWKNAFAERSDADLHIVTQFCFEADPIIAWDKAMQAEGNKLPIHIGLPGLATIKTLLNFARISGVGPSMRFLTRQAMNVHKLVTVSDPNKQLVGLAKYKAEDPNCGITNVHMYPLGGLRRTAAWAYEVAKGEIDFDKKLDGFKTRTKIE